MSYSSCFTLTVSADVELTAAKVGKAFDPDTGGEYSFCTNPDGTLSTSTPCDAEFKATADYLMTDASALHQAITQKYSERWADLTPPTLDECAAFIAAIITPLEATA